MSSGNTLLAHVVAVARPYTWPRPHEDAADRLGEAHLCGAQPHAGAVRPGVHAALPQRPAAGRRQEDLTRAAASSCRKIASGDWDGSSRPQLVRADRHVSEIVRKSSGRADHGIQPVAYRQAQQGRQTRPAEYHQDAGKQKAARETRLKDLLAEEKKDDGLVFDEQALISYSSTNPLLQEFGDPNKMERVAASRPAAASVRSISI